MAGRRINDYGGLPHTSEMAMKSKNHLKPYHSAEGAGEMHEYPDTTEAIHKDQSGGEGKMRSHKMKTGYRY